MSQGQRIFNSNSRGNSGGGDGFSRGGGDGFSRGGGDGFSREGGGRRSYQNGGEGGGGFSREGGGRRSYQNGGEGGGRRNNQNGRDDYQRQEQNGTRSRGAKAYEEKLKLQEKWKTNPKYSLKARRGDPIHVSFSDEIYPQVIKDIDANLKKQKLTEKVTVKEIVKESNEFWDEFPSETARVKSLLKKNVSEKKLEKCLHSVYPLVHQSTLNLMEDFLSFKKEFGTSTEKEVYKDMDMISYVDRLVRQRPLSFLGGHDKYLLKGGLIMGYGKFEQIGQERENYPLILKDYLSYDEMRLAALVSLSSWSMFVNDGNRKNYGYDGKPGTFQEDGVIVGQVGARLKKEGVMEYLDCVITKEENIPENGFGFTPSKSHVNSVWSKFWGVPLLTFDEANALISNPEEQAKRGLELLQINDNIIFNVTVYKKRIAITAEILLCEANSRAKEEGKKAYVHVVGLGLGVWKATNAQESYFIEAWGDAIDNMKDTSNISVIDFSWIDQFQIKGTKSGSKYRNTDITIKFSKRNLHDKVPEDNMLICNYAWDGNSYPGNEFYLGLVCSTGDSAAACSSMVAEVHNAIVNPIVHGARMRIASSDGYLKTCQDLVGAPATQPASTSSTEGGKKKRKNKGAKTTPEEPNKILKSDDDDNVRSPLNSSKSDSSFGSPKSQSTIGSVVDHFEEISVIESETTATTNKKPASSNKKSANGKQPANDDKKPAGNKKNARANNKRPADDSEKPAGDSKNTVTNNKKLADDSKKPVDENKKPVDDSKKPVDSKKPAGDNSKKPAGDNSKKPAGDNNKKPAGDNNKKPADDSKKEAGDRKQQAGDSKKQAADSKASNKNGKIAEVENVDSAGENKTGGKSGSNKAKKTDESTTSTAAKVSTSETPKKNAAEQQNRGGKGNNQQQQNEGGKGNNQQQKKGAKGNNNQQQKGAKGNNNQQQKGAKGNNNQQQKKGNKKQDDNKSGGFSIQEPAPYVKVRRGK